MTISSADPDRLHGFVDAQSPARSALTDAAASGAAFAAAVISRCLSRGLSGSNFPAVTALLDTMRADDEFVRGIADALMSADRHGGIASMSDVSVTARLGTRRYDTSTAPVTIDAVAMLGEPANCGLVDDPINVANGNFVHRDIDLVFPGTSAALDLHRWYNSLAADRTGVFGAGWTSMLDVVLRGVAGGASTVTAVLPDGAELCFATASVSPNGEELVAAGRRDVLLSRTTDGWRLRLDPTAERTFLFAADGRLTGWRFGRVGVTVERDADDRIAALTHDRSHRRIYLTWDGDRVVQATTDDGRSVSYTYGRGDVLVRAESDAGWFDYAYTGRHLVRAVDPDGISQFDNEYDASGRVAAQRTPFGRVTTYRYEVPGLSVITDARGVRQAMAHDHRGNLVAVIDADGTAMRVTYDEHDRATRIVSPIGAEWRHEFDPVTGDLVRRIDPDGLEQSWRWDDRRRLVATTDRSGATTRYEYDGDHTNPCRVIGPDGAVGSAELDRWGRPTAITDADGVVIRLKWDDDGQVRSITDALGNVSRLDYDAAGRTVRVVDPAGGVLELERDRAGRVVRVRRGERLHEYRRTAGGRIVGGSEPATGGWSATLGPHGAPVGVTDAAGATTLLDYDVLGNVVALTAPDGAVYRQRFDDVGRLVELLTPDGGTSRRGYDAAGRLVALVDAAGRVHRRTLDGFGRTISSTGPDGATTRWTYHPGGEVATIVQPGGRTWRTEVDEAGRVVAVIDPARARSTRTYTRAGRLLRRSSPAGRTETFEYDAAGRLVAADGGGLRRTIALDGCGRVVSRTLWAGDEIVAAEAFEWDGHDDLRAHTDRHGTATHFTYDAGGNLIRRESGDGAAALFEYDARGLLTSATEPGGPTTTYRYDQRGRLVEQIAPGGRLTAWEYDVTGFVAGLVDPAGVYTRVERDATGLVTSLRRGASGWSRRFDAAGRETERFSADGTPIARFSYSPEGHLRKADAPTADAVTELLWDQTGRVTALAGAGGTTTIERDADGRATVVAHADGRRVELDSKPPGRHGHGSRHARGAARDRAGRLLVGAAGTVYRYDEAGRVVEVVRESGDPIVVEYGDDGLVVCERSGDSWRHFEYDTAGRVAAINAEGQGTTTFSYDNAGRRDRQVDPDGAVVEFGWDDLDQLVAITRTTPDGEVRKVRIDVDALGRPARVDGHPVDPISTSPLRIGGMVVLGRRVYDPSTHQFLSADPLLTVPGSSGAASAYTYAWHDPVNHVDPTGMRPISIEDYEAIRRREELGRVGQAWEAVRQDPWQTLALVGLVAGGVMIGGPIGLGFVVGVGASTAIGLATGTFDPTETIIDGFVTAAGAGIGAGISSGYLTVGRGMLAQGSIGAAGDALNQYAHGRTIDVRSAIGAGAADALTLGVSGTASPHATTAWRSAAIEGGSAAGGEIAGQTLVGGRPYDVSEIVEAGLGGATTGGIGHPTMPPPTGAVTLAPVAGFVDPGYVSLVDDARVDHILSGDLRPDSAFPAGHRPAPELAGATPFPGHWTDAQILHHVSDVATDPSIPWQPGSSPTDVWARGMRDGVDIDVLIRHGQIWDASATTDPAR